MECLGISINRIVNDNNNVVYNQSSASKILRQQGFSINHLSSIFRIFEFGFTTNI